METNHVSPTIRRTLTVFGGGLLIGFLGCFAIVGVKGGDGSSSINVRLKRLIDRREAILVEVRAAGLGSATQSPVDAYLMAIRKDGLPAHADAKSKLQEVADINVEMLLLAEIHAEHAKPDFKDALDPMRRYVISWNNRWDNVFDTFMAGGNLVGGEPAIPQKFLDSLKSE